MFNPEAWRSPFSAELTPLHGLQTHAPGSVQCGPWATPGHGKFLLRQFPCWCLEDVVWPGLQGRCVPVLGPVTFLDTQAAHFGQALMNSCEVFGDTLGE